MITRYMREQRGRFAHTLTFLRLVDSGLSATEASRELRRRHVMLGDTLSPTGRIWNQLEDGQETNDYRSDWRPLSDFAPWNCPP